jgi:CheY-like chemotaxis protein
MIRQLDGIRILLAEDEAGVRDTLRMLLETMNAVVTEARDGAEAYGLYQLSQFDCVVTDYNMPRMQGDALAIAIKQANPAQRVVMCSGFVDTVTWSTQLPWFLDAFVTKPPPNLNDLIQAIHPLSVCPK